MIEVLLRFVVRETSKRNLAGVAPAGFRHFSARRLATTCLATFDRSPDFSGLLFAVISGESQQITAQRGHDQQSAPTGLTSLNLPVADQAEDLGAAEPRKPLRFLDRASNRGFSIVVAHMYTSGESSRKVRTRTIKGSENVSGFCGGLFSRRKPTADSVAGDIAVEHNGGNRRDLPAQRRAEHLLELPGEQDTECVRSSIPVISIDY
jgi:hypothetical protein